MNNTLNLDYIFEVSWEVCNKVGGIHTVISTKSLALSERCGTPSSSRSLHCLPSGNNTPPLMVCAFVPAAGISAEVRRSYS